MMCRAPPFFFVLVIRADILRRYPAADSHLEYGEAPMRCLFLATCLILSITLCHRAIGDEPPKKDAARPSRDELIKKLEDDLTNVKLIGRFTITGREDREPKAEEYTITSAMKLPDGDLWLLKARIKYGDKDVTMPIPLEIKWAGDTPVITLTNLSIPRLGTFTSRVVIYDNRYAGTWQHGEVGGNLFGKIEKVKEENVEAK